jgi:hypothetical protein
MDTGLIMSWKFIGLFLEIYSYLFVDKRKARAWHSNCLTGFCQSQLALPSELMLKKALTNWFGLGN